MAIKKTQKKPQNGLLIQTLDIKQVNRSSVDIEKWRNALKAAEGQNENRKAIYELYADMLLDGHLKSVVNKRIMSVTNSDIQFTKEGKEVDGMYNVLISKEFKKILRYIIAAKIYGHSLVEFTAADNNAGFTVNLVDRRHVKPRLGLVVKNPTDNKGEAYKNDPYYNFTLEVGEPDDFGLLLQASQYVIYKRGGFGDWADFIQLFGIPFRHGKYENEESRQVLVDALENMGSAGFAATPKNIDIQILRAEGASGANLVFTNFRKACNDEISVTILGQTMTTSDSGNAGYAQGKVHQAVEEQMHLDDKLDVLSILNTDVVRILTNLGLPAQGGEFSYCDIDNTSLTDRIDIDTKVAKLVPVEPDYFYETYGIPKPKGNDTVGGQQKNDKGEAYKKNNNKTENKNLSSDSLKAKPLLKQIQNLLGFFVKAPQIVGHFRSW